MTNNQCVGLLRAVLPVIVACVLVVKVIVPMAAAFKGIAFVLLIVFALTTITKALTTATAVVREARGKA